MSETPDSRAAGILLHPTSLPGPYGIGDLGFSVDRFLDWAAAAGQTLWQVLPLGPTGGGSSPYTSASAFAGNPLLLSPERLVEEGFLQREALENAPQFPVDRVDFSAVRDWKEHVLRLSWEQFGHLALPAQRDELAEFRDAPEQSAWLEDWCRFAALKSYFSGRPWTEWGPDLAFRDADALAAADETLGERDGLRAVRPVPLLSPVGARSPGGAAARHRRRGRHPDLRRARQRRRLGAPGPLPARRDRPAHGGRRRAARLLQRDRPALGQPALPLGRPAGGGLRLVDRAHPLVPRALRPRAHRPLPRVLRVLGRARATSETALGGRWVPGPGRALFDAARAALGALPILAEDLGDIDDDVRALLAALGIPGDEDPAVRLRRVRQPVPAAPSTPEIPSSTPAPTTTTPRAAGTRRSRPRSASASGTTSAATAAKSSGT